MPTRQQYLAGGGAILVSVATILKPDLPPEPKPAKAELAPLSVSACAEEVIEDFFQDSVTILMRESDVVGSENTRRIMFTATALAEKACGATAEIDTDHIGVQMTPLECIEVAGRSAVVLSVQALGEDSSLQYLNAERPGASYGPLPDGC